MNNPQSPECGDACDTMKRVGDERDSLVREVLMLKESRAAACEQEQTSRNEANRLRQQLAGAQAEVEKYRQREFAAYQALGYSPPVDTALPHLIAAVMGIKARLQDSLDSIERATGFQPGTESLATWVRRVVKERDAAQKACAEMRDVVGRIKVCIEFSGLQNSLWERYQELCHALSTDCGKDFVPRERVKPLIVALIQIYASGRQYSGAGEAWAAICTAQSIAKQAIAHARGLGL